MTIESQPAGESTPTYEAFASLLAGVRHRFEEAILEETRTPAYRHFLLDRQPGIPDVLATFLLAESYELARQGKAEVLEFSVPLEAPDTVRPHVKRGEGADYFLLTYPDGDVERTEVINRKSYDALRHQSPDSPLADLPQKLLTYELIPSSKPKH